MAKLFHVLRELSANGAMSFRAIRDFRSARGRTTSCVLSDQVLTTLDQMTFFLGELGGRRLDGLTVVEIGPGDTLPLAFLFLALGAERYVAVDRFRGDVCGERARSLYRSIASAVSNGWDRRVVDGIRGLIGDGHSLERLIAEGRVVLDNSPVEDIRGVAAADLIISFNVLEHCQNLPLALGNMAAILSQQGFAIHRIDYTAHDIWRSYENPLEFLTLPDWLWRLMGSNRGYPNRLRHSEVLEAIRAAGFYVDSRVETRDWAHWSTAVRAAAGSRLRTVSDSDLSIVDAVFVLSKMAATRR